MTLHILALETSTSICGVALLSLAGGEPVVRSVAHDATGEHAERLLPMVDELLSQAGIGAADLSAVAFGQGPGGFTGLRVACGVAQGIALGLEIPVIPVVSLLAVAARDERDTADFRPGISPAVAGSRAESAADNESAALRVVLQDARMGELYAAAYRHVPDESGNPWLELQAPMLLDAGDVRHWLLQVWPQWRRGAEPPALRLLGDALLVYPALAESVAAGFPGVVAGPPLRPDAETIVWLALQAWNRQDIIAPDFAAPLYVRDKVAYTTLERERGLGGNPKASGLLPAIQPMGPEHLDDVAAIERSVQSFPWTRRSFEDGLKSGYRGWVTRQGDKITGFCLVMFAPDVAHVLVLAVAPPFQQQGLGALLLRECEREARARGLPSIILEVRQSNAAAIAFYHRVGFTLLSTRRDYYPAAHGTREDALVMERKLNAFGGRSV